MDGETINHVDLALDLDPSEKDLSDIEQLQYSYFENSNALCRHIISEQKALMKHLGNTWNDLDYKRRDALLDLLFVDDVREQYSNICRHETKEVSESFPTLYVDSGQKINVDFENDLWTWRDEHSGPFSWMSRSQQDLTLTDLEPENISKPQPRYAKGDTDTAKSEKVAEEQFTYPVNSWSRDIIDGFRKVEKSIVVTPSPSEYFSPKHSNNDREEGNHIELTTAPTLEEIPRTSTMADSDSTVNEPTKTDVRERRTRSPSPKKIIRSSSLRRSPSKASDHGEQRLIADKSEEAYEEINSFSNPVMETEWSNFIGDETDTDGPINPDLSSTPQREPVIQIMDRGRAVPGSSPYQGDRVHLISPTDSPSQASGVSAHLASPALSSWSAESTPDHSTHLLKGMQVDDKPSQSYHYQNVKPESQIPDYETEEVLSVESHGNKVKIVTKTEITDEGDIPTTGFDFLDNW